MSDYARLGGVQLLFLETTGSDDVVGERAHLNIDYAQWSGSDFEFLLHLDGRVKKGDSGWANEWEAGCLVPVKKARVLHAWLGFMLNQIDAGHVPTKGPVFEDEDS